MLSDGSLGIFFKSQRGNHVDQFGSECPVDRQHYDQGRTLGV